MYLMEAILRITYVYPTRLCPDAYCELRWTRFVLNSLLKVVGHWLPFDPYLYIETVEFDTVPVRVYLPRYNRTNNGAVIFIHGGGFVLGTLDMYDSIVRKFAKSAGMVAFSIDYRLAPEHIFPAGLDDCERAVSHLLKHAYADYGIDKSRIILMGDSAGGGLTASLTHRLRNRYDIPRIKAQVLIYPLVQLSNMLTPSYRFFYREMEGTAFVDPVLVAQYYIMYAGINVREYPRLAQTAINNGHVSPLDRHTIDQFFDLKRLPDQFQDGHNRSAWYHDEEASRMLTPFLMNPEFSPIMQSDLTGLPPALVVTCEFDVLRDEGALYADRLREAGVPTTWKHFSTGFHAMLNFHSTLGTADRALDYIIEWVTKNI